MKFRFRKKYITARAVIVRDDKLLVFHRKRRDSRGNWIEYYSIPGGELDPGETPEAAAVRELKEEMGVDISLLGRIAHFEDKHFEHYIFVADIDSGEPHLMEDSEEAQRYRSNSNQYHVVWVPVSELTREKLKFYGAFYDHIIAVAAGKNIEEVARLNVSSSVY